MTPRDAAPTVSPSKITSYLLCPRKFAFVYVERVQRPWKPAALAFGSAVHSALEAWQLSRLSGAELPVEEVLRTFEIDWEAEKADELRFGQDEDEAELLLKGRSLLRLALEALRPDPPEAVELPFVVELRDPEDGTTLPARLSGIFDLLLPGDRVVEIKTAARAWDAGTVSRHLQLSAYAFAYEAMTGRAPRVEVLQLLKTRVPRVVRHSTSRSGADHAWFVRLVAEVLRGIDARAFPPNPGWQCADCEFARHCRAWRGTSSATTARTSAPSTRATAPTT